MNDADGRGEVDPLEAERVAKEAAVRQRAELCIALGVIQAQRDALQAQLDARTESTLKADKTPINTMPLSENLNDSPRTDACSEARPALAALVERWEQDAEAAPTWDRDCRTYQYCRRACAAELRAVLEATCETAPATS